MLVGYHRSHEASVAVVDDAGRPLFAASEERFSRVKMQGGWPVLAAAQARARFDLARCEIVHGGLPLSRRFAREAALSLYNARHRKLQDVHPKRFRKLFDLAFGAARSGEARVFPGRPRVHVDHHSCHAASAYYPSGFDEAEVITVDGVGDTFSARVFHARRGRLEARGRRFHTEFPVGHNYEYLTALLGHHPHRHAGKITGLSAHGSRDERLLAELERWLAEVWSADRGRPYFFMLHSQHGSTAGDAAFDAAIRELRGLRQTRFGDWSNADLAWAIQHLLERDVIRLIERAIPRIEGQPICLAGGVFANVKLNKLVKEMGFGSIFIQPAMGDGGLALGAPLYVLGERGALSPYRLESVYLGPEYGADEMLRAIRGAGLEGRRYEPVEPKIAELLAAGRVVARFNGRMEFGPRALGNRSILYHGADASVNDWLNKRLDRTEFMPFAPATLDDEAAKSFLGLAGAEHSAEFMTITFDCSDSFKASCPAAVHVDGTARPQIVRETTNPSFHKLLRHYREITGVGSVVNTSFNMHEEPIVCTPDDAVRSFLRGHLDYLAIGPFIVENPKLEPVIGTPPPRRRP
ncbi:MAG TPA: carbamoyltransferase C-terminal domain-containing protein [Myxococcota bacterium]|nr:carbamoyltransferase C-terminal domain-containing protein [Myxococcota bacterium]